MKKLLLSTLIFLFTLPCFAQFVEDFENTSGITGPLPATWSLGSGNWAVFERNTNLATGTTESWGINAFATGLQLGGLNCASVGREEIGNGNTSHDYLATPMVSVPVVGSAILSFYGRTFTSGNQGTIFRVLIASAYDPTNQTNPNAYVVLQQWTENDFPTDAYQHITLQIPDFYLGQDVYLAFEREYTQTTAGIGGDRWLIDNVLSMANNPICATPTSVVGSAITSNSANTNWIENGTATSWHVLALPLGSPAPLPSATGWVTATANPFTVTGLVPNTGYDIYVRANCNGGWSDWSGATSITTLGAPMGCGGTFTDQGGPTGNYPNNSNTTTTICPESPGDSVTVTFTSFNTQANVDLLRVYNGSNPTVSEFLNTNSVGGFSGTAIPGPFTATNQSGCLTFTFTSNATTIAAGWVANVTCGPAVCNPPTAIAVTSVTNTSAVLNWNNPSNSNAWEVLILPQGSPQPAPSASGNYVQSLPYFATGLSAGICYTIYVRTLCSLSSEWSIPVDFCLVNCENNAECSESLALIAFLDTNNNGVKDNGETNFSYGSFVYQVNDSGVNQYGSSNTGSYFIFDSNATNSYDISFSVNNNLSPYYTSSVTHNNITLPTGGGTTNLYFPVVNTQAHLDAQVSISPYGPGPRPGFLYSNIISYQNRGMQAIASGTLTFTKSPIVSITNISQSGITTTSAGFTYDFSNLLPFETRTILVTFQTPTIPTVALGDLVTNSVSVQINNDADISNNAASLTQPIVGSYDPNDKTESHGGKIVQTDFTANDYLYYTIQFENTGTASAEFIKIEDLLDAQLDENSFEMISASHPVNTKRKDNKLTWHFYNINLPPTLSNPTESHGYIQFKIKPKTGYSVGDIIPNYASIYFDYNPAIITNTFTTEFVQALGNTTFDANAFSLFPNPTNNSVTITNNGTEKISKLTIYEITGKRIYSLDKNQLSTISIDVSSFAKGIYLVEMTSDTNSKITKKLIIK